MAQIVISSDGYAYEVNRTTIFKDSNSLTYESENSPDGIIRLLDDVTESTRLVVEDYLIMVTRKQCREEMFCRPHIDRMFEFLEYHNCTDAIACLANGIIHYINAEGGVLGFLMAASTLIQDESLAMSIIEHHGIIRDDLIELIHEALEEDSGPLRLRVKYRNAFNYALRYADLGCESVSRAVLAHIRGETN